MATQSSRSQAAKSAGASPRSRTPKVIGVVAGAVLGGVLGAIVAKKVRQGDAKRLVPAKVPALAKRAAGTVRSLAHDAKTVAKATAVLAADSALEQVKNAAQQFVVDVASGQPPTPPELASPTASQAPTGRDPAEEKPHPPATSSSRKRASARTKVKKKSAARKKSLAAKKPAKAAKARATR